MNRQQSKIRSLLQDWRWLLVVAALLALPIYGLRVPLHYAFVAHIVGVLLYVTMLLVFGRGHVIEGGLFVLLGVTLFALLTGPFQRAREKHERIKQQQRQGARVP
jgi:membrane protein implicated in regulation of membrane protease activity